MPYVNEAKNQGYYSDFNDYHDLSSPNKGSDWNEPIKIKMGSKEIKENTHTHVGLKNIRIEHMNERDAECCGTCRNLTYDNLFANEIPLGQVRCGLYNNNKIATRICDNYEKDPEEHDYEGEYG